MSLHKLSNDQLLLTTKNLAKEERRINLEILRHLQEISRRKLFLELGFRSLFEYAVKELCYSEDAAYRRLQAMRLLQSVPEIEEKIATGSVSLSAAAKLQSFFKTEEKKNISKQKQITAAPLQPQTAKPLFELKEEKLKLIQTIENKSGRDIEKELLKLNPELVPTEKVRQVSDDKTELRIVVDDELKQKLDQLKHLLSHKNPRMNYKELLEHLAEIALKKLDPNRRNVSGLPRKGVSARPSEKLLQAKCTRHIAKSIKQKVWVRDNGQCSYVCENTGRRCSSKHLLQYDHIQPFAYGGESSETNLRLLCQQHNLWRNSIDWKAIRPQKELPS